MKGERAEDTRTKRGAGHKRPPITQPTGRSKGKEYEPPLHILGSLDDVLKAAVEEEDAEEPSE